MRRRGLVAVATINRGRDARLTTCQHVWKHCRRCHTLLGFSSAGGGQRCQFPRLAAQPIV